VRQLDDDDPLNFDAGGGAKARRARPKRERITSTFYMCSDGWADRAAVAAGRYLILALRIYRGWRARKPGETVIAVTTKMLAGPGYTRSGLRRVVPALARAALIEVISRAPGRAPRVRVIDPKLRAD
jgi:hypothetical protein